MRTPGSTLSIHVEHASTASTPPTRGLSALLKGQLVGEVALDDPNSALDALHEIQLRAPDRLPIVLTEIGRRLRFIARTGASRVEAEFLAELAAKFDRAAGTGDLSCLCAPRGGSEGDAPPASTPAPPEAPSVGTMSSDPLPSRPRRPRRPPLRERIAALLRMFDQVPPDA